MKRTKRFLAPILLSLMVAVFVMPAGAEEPSKGTLSFEPQIIQNVKVTLGADGETGEMTSTMTYEESDQPEAPAEMGKLATPLPDVTVCDDGFENGFPTGGDCPWNLLWCGSGFTWDDDDCRVASGSSAVWCANGRRSQGGNGIDPCTSSYPTSTCAVMSYGPYDFSGAVNAYVEFDWWLRCETDWDYMFVGYSTNGIVYSGTVYTGDFGDLWHYNEVVSLAGASGENQVWVGIGFSADSYGEPNEIPNGAFIDNVRIVTSGSGLPLPDLVVSDIQIDDPECPTQVRCEVTNQGAGEAASSVCRITLEGAYVCDRGVGALGSGQSAWTSWCDLPSYSFGERDIQACADYDNQVGETNNGNNCSTETFDCPSPPPDLIVADMEFDEEPCPTQVRALVRNQGDGSAGTTRCRFWLDGVDQGYRTVGGLGSGQQVWTAWLSLDPYDPGSRSVQACADGDEWVDESNENNNCDTEGFNCVSGELSFYFDDELSACAGDEGVEILVNLQNDQPVKAFGVNVVFDPNTFECTGVTVAGTRAAAAAYDITGFAAGSASAGIVYSVECGPSIAAGDGPVLKLTMNVLPGAPIGVATLDLDNVPPAVNSVTFCDNSTSGPALIDGSVDICGDAFVRGDTDADGTITIQDPIYNLEYLYAGGDAPPCSDAADFDDSGAINLGDPLANLTYQYGYGAAPDYPFPDCGTDPTPDGLTCASYPPCEPAAAPTAPLGADLSEAGSQLRFEAIPGSDADSVRVRMILDTDRALVAFEVNADFETSGLDFAGLYQNSASALDADFLSANADEIEGRIRLGCVVDLGLESRLQPGSHDLGTLVFLVSDESAAVGSRIELVGGIVVNADMDSSPISSEGLVVPPFGSSNGSDLALRAANPFRPGSPISFYLAETKTVRVTIFNVHGQRVRELVSGSMDAGLNEISWDGRAEGGDNAATGIYYLRGKFGHQELRTKLVLVR